MMFRVIVNRSPIFRQGILGLPRLIHTTQRVQQGNNGANTSPDPFAEDDIKTANSNNKDQIFIREPNAFASTPIDPKYRIGYSPLYTGPATQYVSAAKRATVFFTAVGSYVTVLLHSSILFDDSLAYVAGLFTVIPYPLVQLYTRNYVTRIFRLYDKTKEQTLENLITDERLIVEKLSFTGRNTYHQLVALKDIRIAETNNKFGFKNWYEVNPKTNTKRFFYVSDDLGGIKMDRIWGIIEKNSGIDNGRFFGK